MIIKLSEEVSKKIVITIRPNYSRDPDETYVYSSVEDAVEGMKVNAITPDEVVSVSGCDLDDLFPEDSEKVSKSESPKKYYWYVNNSLEYDKTAYWLTRDGRKTPRLSYRSAPLMTRDEARASLNKLNSVHKRKASMNNYLPEFD